jgi:hypothetical protein
MRSFGCHNVMPKKQQQTTGITNSRGGQLAVGHEQQGIAPEIVGWDDLPREGMVQEQVTQDRWVQIVHVRIGAQEVDEGQIGGGEDREVPAAQGFVQTRCADGGAQDGETLRPAGDGGWGAVEGWTECLSSGE